MFTFMSYLEGFFMQLNGSQVRMESFWHLDE